MKIFLSFISFFCFVLFVGAQEVIHLDAYLDKYNQPGNGVETVGGLPYFKLDHKILTIKLDGRKYDGEHTYEIEKTIPNGNIMKVWIDFTHNYWEKGRRVRLYKLRGVQISKSSEEQDFNVKLANIDFSTQDLSYLNVIDLLRNSQAISLEEPNKNFAQKKVQFTMGDSLKGFAMFYRDAKASGKRSLKKSSLKSITIYNPNTYNELNAYKKTRKLEYYAYTKDPGLSFVYDNIPHPSISVPTDKQELIQKKAGYYVYTFFGYKFPYTKNKSPWLFKKNGDVNREVYGIKRDDDYDTFMDIYDYDTKQVLYTIKEMNVKKGTQSASAEVEHYPVLKNTKRLFWGKIFNTGSFNGIICDATSDKQIYKCFYANGANFNDLDKNTPSYAHAAHLEKDVLGNFPQWIDENGKNITLLSQLYPKRHRVIDTYKGKKIYAVYEGKLGFGLEQLEYILLPTGNNTYPYLMYNPGTSSSVSYLYDDNILNSYDWRDYVGVVENSKLKQTEDGGNYYLNGEELFAGFAKADIKSKKQYNAERSAALTAKLEREEKERKERDKNRREEFERWMESGKEELRNAGKTTNNTSHTCPVCGGSGKEYIPETYEDTNVEFSEDDAYMYRRETTETKTHYKIMTCYRCGGSGKVE